VSVAVSPGFCRVQGARVKVVCTVSPLVSDPVGVTSPACRIVALRTGLSRRRAWWTPFWRSRHSDVGPAVCAQHELQSRLGEEGKSRDIVGETEELPAIEELVREMRIDEETAPAVDEGEPNRAVDGSAVPGVPSGHGRRPRAHRSGRSTCSRSWEDDIDRVASLLKFAAEAEDDLAQSARLRRRGTLRSNHIATNTVQPISSVETGALLEADGYATLYGKHGARTIRVGRRTWEVLQQLAAGKELDDRIVAIDDVVAITDERIEILTAAAAGLKEVAPAPLASSRARLACASARRPGGHDSRHARPCFTEQTFTSVRRRRTGRVCTRDFDPVRDELTPRMILRTQRYPTGCNFMRLTRRQSDAT
jgi:hypothetical protein